jgi:hypothetical protein
MKNSVMIILMVVVAIVTICFLVAQDTAIAYLIGV